MAHALSSILMAAAALTASAFMDVVGRDASSQGAEGSEVSLLQTHANVRAGRRGAEAGKGWPQPGDPNLQPDAWQVNALKWLKSNPLDVKIVNTSLSTVALTPTWYVIQEGGYDVLFRALHDFADEPTVQMNAWRGLSDQSWTELGAQHIANYGGPNKGIEYMVEQLLAHPEAKTALCADHLTYQYETLQCIGGLLSSDVNGTRGAAAVDAGLLEAAVHAMRVEADLRPTQHTACTALCLLLQHSGAAHERYAQRLRDLGAVELVKNDLATYSLIDPTPFYYGTTYGEVYPLVPQCQDVLDNIKSAP